MITKGLVASVVHSSDFGVSFKVTCRDYGDTFKVFIPKENVNGEASLKMGDNVNVDFENFFPGKNEVRMNVTHVTLDTGIKSVK